MKKQKAVPVPNENPLEGCYFLKTEYNGDLIGCIFLNGSVDWCNLFNRDVAFGRDKECLAAFPCGADVAITERKST